MLAEISLQNIVDANGLSIAATGLLIVFVALFAITAFIAALPNVLAFLETILPPEEEPRTAPAAVPDTAAHDESVAVAVGYALFRRQKNPPAMS